MKWAIILASALLTFLALADFTGLSLHNETEGPVEMRIRCFKGDHKWQHFVLGPGDQGKLNLGCPRD